MSPPRPPRLFISYDSDDVALRHDVLALANRLRSDGVNAWIDVYEASPAEGWVLWRERQLLAADFVVVVCTPGYRRCFEAPMASGGSQLGWEAPLVRQRMYDDPGFRARVLPVVLHDDPGAVPEVLRGGTIHALPRDYDELYRRVTGQPAVVGPPLETLGHRIDNLGPRSPVFEGREAELEATREALRRSAKLTTYTVLTGMGGIGKTRLAVEHAHLGEDDYDVRWWVHAADLAGLQAGLLRLGAELGLVARFGGEEASVQEVLSWLSMHQRWLLVLDDVREGPAALRGLLPSPCRGHLLITSRSRAWRSIAQVVELPRLSPEAARAVLVQRGGRPDDGHAAAVAEQLEHLPLALASAGAYIEATQCSFREYLDGLLHDAPSLLDDPKSVPDDSQQNGARTWSLSLAQIRARAPAAAALLDWLAFLDPAGVPIALLRRRSSVMPPLLRTCVGSRIALDDAIAVLIEFGMVERDRSMLRIHRLIQAVTRDELPARERRRLGAAVVRWLAEVFAYVPGRTLVQKVPPGIAEQIMAASAITSCTRADRERMAWLLLDLGDFHSMRGASHAAYTAYARAVDLLEACTSARAEGTRARRNLSIALGRLGGIEQWAGNLAAARRSFSRALELRSALAYEDPRSPEALDDLASALGKLGDLALAEGKLAEAVELHVQAVELREPLADAAQADGAAQRALARSSRRLARAQLRLGELDEAARALQSAHAILEAVVQSTPEDPFARRDLSLVLADLGEVLELRGAHAEARALHERVLGIVEGLAFEDPGNARAQRDLSIGLNRWGLLEQRAGHLPEARLALAHAEALRQALADANPEDLRAQQDLARSRTRLESLARLEAQPGAASGEPSVEATAPGCSDLTFGRRAEPRVRTPPVHPLARYLDALDEAAHLEQLGMAAKRSGNLETARTSLRMLTEITNVLAKVDPRRRQALGRAARALYELGCTEHELGAVEPARAHLRRARDLFAARLAIDSTDAASRRRLARCLGELGQVELACGDDERAGEVILRCRRMFEDALVDAPRDDDVLRDFGEVLVGLGTAHVRRGQVEAAHELLQRNLELAHVAAELEPRRPRVQVRAPQAMLRLAELEVRLGNLPEARELFRLILESLDLLLHADPENACAALDLVLMHAEPRNPAA